MFTISHRFLAPILLAAGLAAVFFAVLYAVREPVRHILFAEPTRTPAATTTEKNGNVAVIAGNLSIPWEVAFLPDGDLLVTERPGTLLRLGEDDTRIDISGVKHTGEGGLLGLALHPDFEENKYIYLYLTTETEEGTRNRVERYRIEGDTLSERKIIIDGIPGASYHDGGRIAFGPDGKLYITTGDAGRGQLAQERDSLAGKILRLNPDGSVPEDNPFGTPVYTWGHRNPQGLAWDDTGQLWATEHGRSGIRSGLDELNRIEKGANYGWPEIQGDDTDEDMRSPVVHSGPATTWAPAGAAFYKGSIFFAGLRGKTLYEAVLPQQQGTSTPDVTINKHLEGDFGRLRAVKLGPDGYLYVTTSNTDGRGQPRPADDRILRFDPAIFQQPNGTSTTDE